MGIAERHLVASDSWPLQTNGFLMCKIVTFFRCQVSGVGCRVSGLGVKARPDT